MCMSQNNIYRRLGELIAASVVQGGSRVHLFNQSVFQYICGESRESIRPTEEDISDFKVKSIGKGLKKYCSASL